MKRLLMWKIQTQKRATKDNGGWLKERSTKMVLEFSSGKTVPSTRVNSDKTRWRVVAA